jgi:hypothetical protein
VECRKLRFSRFSYFFYETSPKGTTTDCEF